MGQATPEGGLGFRERVVGVLAGMAVVIAIPFALINLLDGRTLLAASALAMMSLMALHAALVWRGSRFAPITLFLLVPAGVGLLASILLQRDVLGLLWCYPAILAYYCLLPERAAWGANALVLAVMLPIASQLLVFEIVLRAGATLVATSLLVAILTRVIDRQRRRLLQQIDTDPLTGVGNRRSLASGLELAACETLARGVPMTLLALDLDHFKRINDLHGHAAGDEVLRAAGGALRAGVRRSDAIWRTGGEEFLVLLRGASPGAGVVSAEHLLERFRGGVGSPGGAVTVSIGVATFEPGETTDAWWNRADRALYRAKAAGRDRVVAAPQEVPCTKPATSQRRSSYDAKAVERLSSGDH